MNERIHDFMHPSDDEGPGHDTHAIGFFDYAGEYEGTAHDLHHYTDATPAGFTDG